MKILILIFILYFTICAPFNQNEVDEELIEQEFDIFVAKYNRMYFTMEEKERRLGIFKTNYILITEHNMRNEDWKMGVNQFADMTPKEHRDMFHNLQVPKRMNQEPKNPTDIFIDLNKNQTRSKEYKIDWRNETGKIVNQLLCGSCYAFSAVESLQWEHFHVTGKFEYLSQQQIVDCSLDYGNDGCQGGWPDQCFNYTQHVGILTADQYPYTAYFLPCKREGGWKNTGGWKDAPKGNDNLLAAALMDRPISVVVDAESWFHYKSGIIKSKKDCGTYMDHAVFLVGADVSGETPIWRIKNSWGLQWGELGYIRVARDVNGGTGPCGISLHPSYALAYA